MEKLGQKVRDIKFFSAKNQNIVIVHTSEARIYTKYLEDNDEVASYVAGKPLDSERLQLTEKVDIRSEYFKQQWASDFYILFRNGSVAVREISNPKALQGRASVEKLELSRRYWKHAGVTDWKIVLAGGDHHVC